jgi:PAS domain S-box-containing protein
MARPVNVLHVDDEPDLASLTREFLEREFPNFSLDYRQDATAALTYLQRNECHCIVSDYQMPGMDGLELLREVREEHPRLPFVLFTGQGSEEIASKAISAGVDEYIQKAGGTERYTVLGNRIENLVDGYLAQEQLSVMKRAMDSAPIGILLTDPHREDNPIVYCNDGFAKLTGYRRHEILGRNCRFLQGDRTDPDTVTELRKAIDAEQPVSEDVLNYRADGKPFWNRLDNAPVYDQSEELLRYVGFQRDITEQRRAQEQMREALDRISDAFFALDLDWRFTYVNEEAEGLLDRKQADLVGTNVWAEFPAARESIFEEQYERAMETQEAVTFSAENGPLDTEFEVRAYPSETGLSVYFHDTSE